MPGSPPGASSMGSSNTDAAAPSTDDAATRATAPLWRAMDEAAVSNLPEYAAHWTEEGRALVSVEGAVAASRAWRVGDRLAIPLPQLSATYRPLISAIEEGPGGSRSAVARTANGGGPPLRAVVTAGPGNVFAWVETPEGAFELFADGELGWLLPTSSMTANMDFSQTDQVVRGSGQGAVGSAPSLAGGTE